VSLYLLDPTNIGQTFQGPHTASIALRVPDVGEARKALEAKGVEFAGDTMDTGVCHMAFFRDPDGNDLMLHHRYAARAEGRTDS
jgi:predicted enzyme related to lactoylglutathione lyase